jgi:RNA polymerase sigma-70 factor (ECF subfamily)
VVVQSDPLAELAEAASHGDDRALGDLVRATQHDVVQLCRILGDPEDVEDLAQETYLRMLRALPSFRGEAPVRVWLLSIARRVCADNVRRRTRRRRLAERAAPVRREHVPGVDMSTEQLLEALDADQRLAFVLTQILELPYAEAAAICGCPIGTIRSRVARARASLTEQLDAAEAS